jgi:hypothetical protein
MFKKVVSLSFAVAVIAFVTVNVATAHHTVRNAIPVTAPVIVGVADNDSSCCGHYPKTVVARQYRSFHYGFHRAVVGNDDCCCPNLVPVDAYKKTLGGFRPVTVWVEKTCGCHDVCDCAKLAEPTCCRLADFEPFDAYRKTLGGFKPVTAWKKIPVCSCVRK